MTRKIPAAGIGIFGGSFDPPHLGHLYAAHWALATGEIDCVLIVPTFRHAFGKEHAAPFELRLAMCHATFDFLGERGLVSPMEGQRGGVSYAIDTVQEILASFAANGEQPTLRWIGGTDIEEQIRTWRDGDKVLSLARPLIVPRMHPERPAGSQIDAIPPLSSTDIRARVRAGLPLRGFVHHAVERIIAAEGLYR